MDGSGDEGRRAGWLYNARVEKNVEGWKEGDDALSTTFLSWEFFQPGMHIVTFIIIYPSRSDNLLTFFWKVYFTELIFIIGPAASPTL